MIETLEEFEVQFRAAAINASRFCFLARAKEFQITAIDELQQMKQHATRLKDYYISQSNEDDANRMLSYENMLQGFTYELKMWITLKDDDPNTAWGALVEAGTCARTALQAHSVASHMEDYILRLDVLEHLLFPPQIFVSVGIIVKESKCSICGSEYGDCDHLKGRPYMGEMCAREITEANLLEVSVVDEPANRHCRMLNFTEDGVTRDLMTWRVIKDQGDVENLITDRL